MDQTKKSSDIVMCNGSSNLQLGGKPLKVNYDRFQPHQITLIFQISSPRTLYISISECNAKIHPKGSLIFLIYSDYQKSTTSNETRHTVAIVYLIK